MRISELSEISGVSAATIKYYTRESLLPAGERTGYNQTEYGGVHVDRLRLIRALIEVGGLSVSAARNVLRAIDDEGMPLPHVFGIAQHALPQRETPARPESIARVRAEAHVRGWHTAPENPGLELAAGVLDAYEVLGRSDLSSTLGAYAAAAEQVAAADLDALDSSGSRAAMAETVVVGTVLGDTLFAGLRRLAQEAETARRYSMSTQETTT
ncbi:MAG: MerR family transcriptional regulator [Candidatus Microbacterium phytovorans]|uniref:MerR family transcriptional regulator n=1 Tax=Candidatus Microbacterium phytovorans TaxID=3121374 RepID=A0AAJ5W2W6_9MICO|nr:MerR family transcriptional regulator [Microbacterium sp.]WEK14560.1 MAG: MerR family transcriptional regulator [Microbacterium sp.]